MYAKNREIFLKYAKRKCKLKKKNNFRLCKK